MQKKKFQHWLDTPLAREANLVNVEHYYEDGKMWAGKLRVSIKRIERQAKEEIRREKSREAAMYGYNGWKKNT